MAICQDKGLLVQARGSHGRTNVVRLVPPMVCSDAEIDEGMAILDAAFAEAAGTEAAAERRAS